MPDRATNSSDNALSEILQRLALLERTELLQLQEHLLDLISLFPPLLAELSSALQPKQELDGELWQNQAQHTTCQLPNELLQYQAQQATPLHGSRGGGGIEWKLIRPR